MHLFCFDNNECVVITEICIAITKFDVTISINDVFVKEIDFDMKVENS